MSTALHMPLMRRAVVVVMILATLTGLVLAQGRQGRQGGGPPVDYRTTVPAHDIDVIQARPTMDAMTVSVLASHDIDAVFSYEPAGASQRVTLRAGVPREIEVTGLRPGQAYRYTLAADRPLATGTFRTARPAGEPFTFAVQADSHLDGNTDPRVYANTLGNMVADRADFLLDLGDTFMTDKYPVFTDAAKQYLAQRYYFGLVGLTMPIFLVPGNHDGEVGWNVRDSAMMARWSRESREKYFPPVRSNAFYRAGPAGSAYYAWSWGDALCVTLDPFTFTRTRPGQSGDGWAWTLGRAQYEWLDDTLARSHARYVFVFIHHLVGGAAAGRSIEARGGAEASRFFEWGGANADGSPGFAAHRPGWRMPVHDLLRAHGVAAVFHGHDHLYAHQERDGLVYQAVPQPGHVRGDAIASAHEYGYDSGTRLGSSGHVRVSVGVDQATVEYVRSRLTGRNADVADRYVMTAGVRGRANQPR